MKRIPLKALVAAIACTTLLASCGGGDDDDAGSVHTPFGVTPDSIDMKGENETSCYAGNAGDVLVSGGAAPYRIVNLLPGVVDVSPTTVGDRNQTFTITYLDARSCFEGGEIVVIDALDRQVSVTLSSAVGDEQ